jgi:hypothetical protein
MFLPHVFDTKIIDDKAKGDGTGFMTEQARGVGAGVVTMGSKVFFEAGVGNDAGLREAIHPFADLNQYTIIVDNRGQVILSHDGRRNVPDVNPHVLVPVHGIVEVEILNVKGAESGTRGGNNTVEEELGCGQVGGFGGDIAWILDAVAPTGAADTVLLGFVGLEFGDNPQIGGCAPGGQIGFRYEKDGVCTGGHVGKNALGQPAKLIGGALQPQVALGASKELMIGLGDAGGGIQDGIGRMLVGWGLRRVGLGPVGESVGFGVKVGNSAALCPGACTVDRCRGRGRGGIGWR